ncbi:MAG: GWxTD domain-containing protein [Gemmatimonadota bacterium]|nr:GWxTD domain-containing protein [Gemmatimonadota bacterium]
MARITNSLLVFAFCISILTRPVEASGRELLTVTSEARDLAFGLQRGEGAISVTEIWVVLEGNSRPKRIKTYPGELGDLHFDPAGEGLIYLERSLRNQVWASSYFGGQLLPIAKNGIWKLSLDGAEEDLWPLPNDFQPDEIAPSPDGRQLAIIGYRGNFFERINNGLWVSDETAGIKLLFAGKVNPPVLWSVDGTSVSCRIQDGSKTIRIQVNTGEISEAQVEEAGSKNENPDSEYKSRSLSTAVLEQTDSSEIVLGMIGAGLNLYIRGKNALHRGNEKHADKMFKNARSAFRHLYDEAAKYGLSRKSCTRYINVCEFWIESKKHETEITICQEHLAGMLGLIQGFKRGHDERDPSNLEELHQWTVQEKLGGSPGGNERKDRIAILDLLFSCPANFEYKLFSDYLYKPEKLPGAPAVACFWHSQEQIYGSSGPDGIRTKRSALQPARVDSLVSLGNLAVERDNLEQGRLIFRNVARQRPKDPEAYISLGHVLLTLKRFKESKEAFHRALRLGSKAEAHYGLGMLYKTWPMQRHFAIHHFTEALIKDRRFVDARYQMARVRYDMKERDAELEAKRVLDLDPEHAGACLLIADYYLNLSWEFEKAVVWYTKYLALRPEDADAQRSLGIAYLKVRDYSKIMNHLFDFVQRHPNSIELMPIVAISAIKQDSLDMAMRFFEDYISGLAPDEQKWYEDVTHIASGEELKSLGEAEGTDRAEYLERFWNSKDPDLSTPVNERQLEHYRRVWYALTEFSKSKKPWDARGEVYIRFGEPDHRSRSDDPNFKQSLEVQRVKERLAFQIYKADIGAHTFVGPVFPVRSLKQLDGAWYDLKDINNENASGSSDPDDVGDVPGDDSGIGTSTGSETSEGSTSAVEEVTTPSPAPNDEVSIGILPTDERLGFGDYHPVTSGDDPSTVPWETWIYVDVAGGIEITFTDEIGSGTYDYAPIPTNQGGMSIRQSASLSTNSPRSVFQRASSVAPDFYVPEDEKPPLDFHYSLADFKGAEDRSLLEIYFGVPILPAHYVADEDVTRQVLTHHAALISSSLDTVYRQMGEITYEAAGNQAGEGLMAPDVLKLNLSPGAFRLEVKSQDRLRGRMGIYQQQVIVEAYGDKGLQISDLELAWQVGETRKSGKFTKGDLYVVPMPSRTYRKGQSVFVYYEIYNLNKDEFGQTKYNVSYTITSKESPGNASNISRLFRWEAGKREELAVTYEQLGDAEREMEYVELALDEQVPGRYSLKVSINDMNSGESVEKDVVFVIAR